MKGRNGEDAPNNQHLVVGAHARHGFLVEFCVARGARRACYDVDECGLDVSRAARGRGELGVGGRGEGD